MTSTRSRRALLALYPARWRGRYEDEVLSFLDDEHPDGHLPVRTAADLAAAAVVERARTAFDVASSGAGDATRGLRLLAWGWWCCAIGGIGFAKLTEHFSTFSGCSPRVFSCVTATVSFPMPAANAAYGAVQVAALLAFALVTMVAAPAVVVATARASRAVRRSLAGSVVVAVGCSAVAVGWLSWMVVWASSLSERARNGADARYSLAALGLAALVAAALAGWTRVVSASLRAVEPARAARAVVWCARGASGCAVVVALGVGAWWASVGVEAPRSALVDPVFGGFSWSQWPLVACAQALLVAGAALTVAGSVLAGRARRATVAAA